MNSRLVGVIEADQLEDFFQSFDVLALGDQAIDVVHREVNPLSPLSDPLNGAPKRPTPKANS